MISRRSLQRPLSGSNLRLVIAVAVLLLVGSGAGAAEPRHPPDAKAALAKIVAGSHCSAADKARDRYRHPLETLLWMGIDERMTVVEVWPGGGWYTDILAPLLKEHGRYYAAVPGSAKRFREKLAANAALYGHVVITELDPPRTMAIAADGSADLILTFRNVHNWMSSGAAQEVFMAMARGLKPGGVLGVVEHRGRAGAEQDPRARSGYVTEQQVIQFAQGAGLRLSGRSEINANPKDTKDHPQGVWTLPPSLAVGDVNRDKYLAIGESDRMTLKFVRPEGATSKPR